jgi:hypothetical protein
MRKYVVPAALALSLAAASAASADQPSSSQTATPPPGDSIRLTTGVDYSVGNYGDKTPTDILYVPVTGTYAVDRWILKLTVPYIMVTGPGNVVRGIGVIKGRKAGPQQTESGLGDIVAGVTRNVADIASTGTLIDLTGKIKFGTASASEGLGTGENDYSGQVDVTQRVTSALSVFGSLGYDFIGSPPGADLHDVVYGETGAALKLGGGLTAGAILDLSQAPSPTSGAQREITAYLTEAFSQHWKLQIYGVHGFALGSPDWGGGAMATFIF